jgi:energy-converting hydrogenase Eha subunit B
MSARKPAKTHTQTPAKRAPKARLPGAQKLNRRGHALRRRASRKRTNTPIRQSLSLYMKKVLWKIPRAAWICAAVACVNAVCWSILMPPFQVPDEPTHFAYTQQLAENAKLPSSDKTHYSPEEEAVLLDVHQFKVRQTPERRPISTNAEQQHLEEGLKARLSRRGNGDVGGSYSDPPLYYLSQIIPYGLASAGTLLDQLEAMRLLSSLMAGLAALFTFLFVREALPKTPWAWTVGALSVALAPLMGFMSGAVNPGSMLVAVSAAILYVLARAFRRGATPKLMTALGALTAVGFLTSLNFVGLAPGIVFGMIVLTILSSRTYGRRRAFVSLGLALAIAATPVYLYVFVNLLSGTPVLGAVTNTLKLNAAHGSILGKISYIWQLYLPRLPGMSNYFPGISATRELWFNRGVGYYGWLDTSFPTWVDNIALLPAGIIALLFVRELAGGRSALRRRILECAVYVAIAAGLLVLLGLASYINTAREGVFAEPRYLLPLLPLLGLVLALAARGAGRRWGLAAGAAIVVLFLAHDIFSQLLVVGRYYG